jgi:hypothetical protein
VCAVRAAGPGSGGLECCERLLGLSGLGVGAHERERFLGDVAPADQPFVALLISSAPASRIALLSLGKIPTTLARRPISRLTRSSGLGERSFDQRAVGKP